jgi:hypothetical protein
MSIALYLNSSYLYCPKQKYASEHLVMLDERGVKIRLITIRTRAEKYQGLLYALRIYCKRSGSAQIYGHNCYF